MLRSIWNKWLRQEAAKELVTEKEASPQPFSRVPRVCIPEYKEVWYKENAEPHRQAIYRGTVSRTIDYTLEGDGRLVRMCYDEDDTYIACGNLKANEGDVILFYPAEQIFLLMELPEFRHKWRPAIVRTDKDHSGGSSHT